MSTAAQTADGPRVASPPADHHRPFGGDTFGIWAERFARFFGTPRFILGQTAMIIVWIALNAAVVALRWDPYPFILLNLLFSTQAAYAAPLILLAQTRQADRDHIRDDAAHEHAARAAEAARRFEEHQAELLAQDKQLSEQHARLLAQNTALTEQVVKLTKELHEIICAPNAPRGD